MSLPVGLQGREGGREGRGSGEEREEDEGQERGGKQGKFQKRKVGRIKEENFLLLFSS